MKKLICLICFIFLIVLSSCSEKVTNEIKIIVPNGTPYLAIGGLLEEENVTIEAVSGPANLQTALVSGSHDIVIAPVNLGVNLYNKGNSNYQMSHILTLNNAYIVTKSENKLESILDLQNEKVLGFGETGIPGNLLKKIYSTYQLDLNNVDFKYASSANVYSVFAGGSSDAKYALMSEPEISKLIIKDNLDIKIMDLCDVLGVEVAQACVYVNPKSENQEDINKVLNLIKNNVDKLNNNPETYVDKIITLDRSFSASGKDVLINSIPKTNIVFIETKTNKNIVEEILNILGVNLPNDEFYR